MSRRNRSLRRTPLPVALLATAALVHRPAPVSAAPTTAPTTQPGAPRDEAAIAADLKQSLLDLNKATAGDATTDPAKRAAAAPTVIPLVQRAKTAFHEYHVAHHTEATEGQVQQVLDAELYLFGDKETVARVNAAAGSPVAAESVPARAVQLQAGWSGAGHNAAAQQPVADELMKLDAAHPDSTPLTRLTYEFAISAASPDVKGRLQDVLSNTMTTPMAKRIASAAKAQQASAQKLQSLPGKPLALSGTTVDGKPFSIDQYKGKVVLVDFWATWCGPCKVELPRVKEMYAKYHDQGLEIVGVSNDYSAEAVKKFTPENGMPWVELFDAKAAAAHRWNPVTEGFGINGIPTMFLVDKKGVLRTVEARREMETLIPQLLAE